MLRRLLCLTVALELALSTAAFASWPQWRMGPDRMALSELPVTISHPGIRWRFRTGGAVSQVRFQDLTGDGLVDLLSIEGGRVVARGASGAVLWDTLPVLAQTLLHLGDVDGDGTTEALVRTTRTLMLLDGASGTLLWESPPELVVQMGEVVVADVQGDGAPEIAFTDLGINQGTDSTVFVYTFPSGPASGVLLSKTPPACDGEPGRPLALADVTGDGVLDVVHPGWSNLCVYDALTGGLLYQSGETGAPMAVSSLATGDVDGDGADEVFVLADWTAITQPSRHVFAFDVVGGSLELVWTRSPGNLNDDHHRWPSRPLVDIDGDGQLDVVTSFWEDGVWRVEVLDPVTGAVRGTVPGRLALDVTDVNQDGKPELLAAVTTALKPGTFADKIFYALDLNDDSGLLEATAVVSLAAASLRTGPFEVPFGESAGELLAIRDGDGDGIGELLELRSYGAGSTVLASAPLSGPLNGVQVQAPLGEPRAALLYASGEVAVVDAALAIMNDADGDGTGDLVYAGFNAGRVTGLSGDPVRLAVPEGGGRLAVLDGAQGNPLLSPPVVVEAQSNIAQQPLFVRLGALGDGFCVLAQDPSGRMVLRVLTVGGLEVSSTVLGGEGGVFGLTIDPLVWDPDGDGVDAVFLLVSDSSFSEITSRLIAVDPVAGVLLWTPAVIATPGGAAAGMGALDVGPYAPALLVTANTRRVAIAASTGAVLHDDTDGVVHYYGQPVIVDLDGDGAREVLIVGTHTGLLALEPDLTPRWSAGPGSSIRASGAVIPRPGGSIVAAARTKDIRLDFYDGATGTHVETIALAFGEKVDPLSPPDGSLNAPISSVVPVLAMGPAGVPAFLVTADDGTLYAIDAVTHEILWRTSLGGLLGAPALLDVDGDGDAEIAVPAATGHLVLLDDSTVDPVAWVRENDGTGPALTEGADLDQQEWSDRVHVNWQPVPEATGYAVALYSQNGTLLAERPSLGVETMLTVSGLSLQPGQMVKAGVRSVRVGSGSAATSDETFSDGVTIVDQSAPAIDLLTVEPPLLTPDGDGEQDEALITAHAVDKTRIVAWELTIARPGEAPVRTFTGTPASPELSLAIPWSGTDEQGTLVPVGTYDVTLRVFDQPGNEATATAQAVVCYAPFEVVDGGCEGALPGEDTGVPGEDIGAPDKPDAGTAEDIVAPDGGGDAEGDASGGGTVGAPDSIGGDDADVVAPEEGCSCDQSGGGLPATDGLLLLLVAAMILARLRRETRSHLLRR